MKLQSVRGMNDIFFPEMHLWHFVEEKIRRIYKNFGYSEIRTPYLESTQLFQRGVGNDTDIVEKEMYTFEDRSGESLSLRPEGTASVVRAIVEHNLLRENPIMKLYYLGPMFRHERPQKGRYRQFYQYGTELIGTDDPWSDIEVMAIHHMLYQELKLSGQTLRLNSIGCSTCRPKYKEKLTALLEARKGEIPEDFHPRIQTNPQRIFDHKSEKLVALKKELPLIINSLCEVCQKHFEGVQEGLKTLGIEFVIDPMIVRGLDYYNRTAFEFDSKDLGAQSAVGGGGRYNDMIEQLGGKSTPAVGYAGGLERLIMILEVQNQVNKSDLFKSDVSFVFADQNSVQKCMKWAYQAREMGLQADVSVQSEKSMKAQLKNADKAGSRYCFILGEREIQNQTVVLKDMSTQTQEDLPWGQIDQTLQKLVNQKLGNI